MKPFTRIAVVLLALFGLVHLIRLFTGWPVTVNGFVMPLWISAVALFVAWALAALVLREHRR